MDEELSNLYQEIILYHNKFPCNFHKMESHTHSASGLNPVCGDEIDVYLHIKNKLIDDISFTSEGCAISKAAASLMTLAIKGKTISMAHKEFEHFNHLLTADNISGHDSQEIGDLAALRGVRQFPARIKCATLAWHTLKSAILSPNEIEVK